MLKNLFACKWKFQKCTFVSFFANSLSSMNSSKNAVLSKYFYKHLFQFDARSWIQLLLDFLCKEGWKSFENELQNGSTQFTYFNLTDFVQKWQIFLQIKNHRFSTENYFKEAFKMRIFNQYTRAKSTYEYSQKHAWNTKM